MADSRQFVDILDDDLVKFSKENGIETTPKKAEYDVRIFREYLDTIQSDETSHKCRSLTCTKVLM